MKIVIKSQEIIKKLIYKSHFFIFKKPPGEFANHLLKNLFFALFGIGGTTLITFGFNIIVIRYLGPMEWGKLNLVGSVAGFLVILPLWGSAIAVPRYLGAERQEWQKIIGSAFAIILSLSLIFFPLYMIIARPLQSFLKIDSSIYNFSLFYAFILILFNINQSFFQGLEKFRKLSFLLIGSAVIFVGTTSFYLFYLQNTSFTSLLWGNVWRNALIIIAGIIIFRKSILKFNLQISKKLFHYGAFSMLTSWTAFLSLGNIDNIMINYYLGPTFVGLYSAYYVGFNVFIGKIASTITYVFLPMASGAKDVKLLFKHNLIIIRKLGIFILIGNFLIIWAIFKFYGNDFPFNWTLGALMAINITLYFFLMIFGTILLSIGIRGVRAGVLFSLTYGIINVFLNFLLIPRFEIFGAIIGSIFANIVILAATAYFIKTKLIKEYSEQK